MNTSMARLRLLLICIFLGLSRLVLLHALAPAALFTTTTTRNGQNSSPSRTISSSSIKTSSSASLLLAKSLSNYDGGDKCPHSQKNYESSTLNRRNFFGAAAASTTFLLVPPPNALAAAATTDNPFDAVRYELNDSSGGLAYMQNCIDKNDFASLMEFTKQYDQILRKASMGKAKKLLPKELRSKATEISNAVTFDLIGMNRSSRPGQEDAPKAQQYLNELKIDVQKLLDMEGQVAAE